ncbi:MAG: type II secretion system F family protein [Thermoguttaceae bacterium]
MAAIGLDQLIALNEEIAALVRLGVPLELGLERLGEEMPGASGKAAAWLAQRLREGQTLDQVLAQEPEVFPPVYRAVVEAGLKAGRLSAALESLAVCASRLADTRRMVGAAFIYPILVLLVAWGLFIVFTVVMAPAFLAMFQELRVPGQGLLETLAGWGQLAWYWGPAVPVLVLLAATIWWSTSGRPALVQPRAAGWLLGWLPWTRRMLREAQVASFAEVLALLVEHRVPLPEAVTLAGQAVGQRQWELAAHQIADSLRRGQPLSAAEPATARLPPLLRWQLLSGQSRGTLWAALRHAADAYHERARHQAEKARVFLPILVTLAIGGGVVALYAALVFGCWFAILRTLTGI